MNTLFLFNVKLYMSDHIGYKNQIQSHKEVVK